jgi:hypothetical protein
MVFASFVLSRYLETDRRLSRTSAAKLDWIIGRFLGENPLLWAGGSFHQEGAHFGDATRYHVTERSPPM